MNQVINKNNNEIMSKEKETQLIKEVYFKGASDEEMSLFMMIANKTGLSIPMKQLYPVKRWDSTLKKEVMTIQTGIDGYRLIAERTGCYSPGKEACFTYDDGKLISATAYVKKLTKDGTWHEVSGTAFYSEYCQRTKEGSPTSMWAKMPHSQLAKCAEALALRKAFPAELSGLYTKEEMEQAEVIQIQESPAIEEKISQDQCFELEDIISACSSEYKKQLFIFLNKQHGISRIEDLPLKIYERVKTAALKKKEENENSFEEVAV